MIPGAPSQDTYSLNSRYEADYQQLRQQLARDLNLLPQQLCDESNLIQQGLDSMRMMRWLHWFRQKEYQVTLRELYTAPTLVQWRELMHSRLKETQNAPTEQPRWPLMTDGIPFPLTPVQHAYLTGRMPGQLFGGVGCHLYQEFDGQGLTAQRLEEAVDVMLQRHPMLHIAFRADGQQYYQQQSFWNGVTVHDLRQSDSAGRSAYLQALRQRLSHRLLRVEIGETFDFQLTLLPKGRHRLHVSIDLLIMDASSFTLFFDEINALLAGESLTPVDSHYDFRCWLQQQQQANQQATEQARTWWLAKAEHLPSAPVLPLVSEPATPGEVRNTRRRMTLPADRWGRFSQRAGDCGVTPTMMLATCFSAVLARWGGLSRLLLNLTLFDRPLHPAVDNMLADFTNILLLDVACYGDSPINLARKNQLTFTEDWEHRHWSGVELLRELKRQQRYPHGAPVVFTSNPGRSLYSSYAKSPIGEPAWGISQTPQVWIDHLAFEHQGEIYLQWDSNEALFPTALVETLFETYCKLINQLCDDSSAWSRPFDDLMPASQREVRIRVNDTNAPLPEGLLYERILSMAQQQPQALAVVDSRYQWRYDQLAEKARRCAKSLTEHGVRPGDNVAITLSKGAGQLVCVLGILLSGAVYVPVSRDQPASRREKIYTDASVRLVLVCQHDHPLQSGAPTLSWQQAITAEPLITPIPRNSGQPAYIIYTSGSTGTPKGVVISHRSALNTCVDINRRYQVNPQDRVLALSALHFDLSVYDIFGVLSAGGAVIIAAENQRRDPRAWSELIERHQVTIWNSVPALFDMLLTWCEGFSCSAPARLRAVMLSGDWIGLDLPARYRAFRPQGEFIAMGGATEAAIWSNACDIKQVPAHWRSVPYGYPLSNQRYRVVDELGRDCPDWVVGELWIGGVGVAEGYFNDPLRSEHHFVMWSGERWYRTGDTGCYWPDGTLEFLGRRDKQVKVGGYRIETGEIEHALGQIAGVKQAVVLAMGEKEKTLAAFVVPQGDALCVAHHRDPALPDNWQTLLPPVSQPALRADEADAVADFLLHLLRLQPSQSFADDPPALMAQCGIQPRWRTVVDRWLAFLVKQQRLQPVVSGYYVFPRSSCAGRSCQDAIPLTHQTTLRQILAAERDPLTLLSDPLWAPENLALRHPASAAFIADLAQVCIQLARRLQRPVRLLEIGCRSASATAELLSYLNGDQIDYVALEQARELVSQAQKRLSRWPYARVLPWSADSLATFRHTADLIWVNNALHRLLPDDRQILATLHQLATPGALIYVTEFRQLTPLSLLSTLLLVNGNPDNLLYDSQHWVALFDKAALPCQYHDEIAGLQRLMLKVPDRQQRPDVRKLQAALGELLPSWMVPQRLFFTDALPLTANGKIDTQSLRLSHTPQASDRAEAGLPQGEIEQLVASLWQSLLSITPVYRDSDFFRHGGDSLLATRLTGQLHQAGYRAQLSDLFNHPTLVDFAATLRKTDLVVDHTVVSHPDVRFDPFALTEVQQAYLVGRQPGFALGGTGSHFFVEFEIEQLDVARLEKVWNRLVARHDMLRAVVRDGCQQVLEHPPVYVIPVQTLCTPEEALAWREKLAHQVLDPAHWPVFDLQVALSDSLPARVWLCLDNLLLDGLSMQILLAELEEDYRCPQQQRPPLPVTFRDYLQHPSLQSPHPDSLAWWRHQLSSLPPAPALPLHCAPQDIATPRFVRLSSALEKEQWRSLKRLAANARLTPSAVLLAAWATVLSAWCARPDFTLNLTLFDRRPLHPQINQILGDFTSLMLLAWHPADSWLHSAQQLQQRLSQNLNHRDVSALWVMRQLAQQQNLPAMPMPVVFTSALGFEQDNFLAHRNLLKPVWGISQTPQVWLDHQVYQSEGELRFNWDFVAALFPPGQLETQFAQYTALLTRLSQDETSWHLSLASLVPPIAHRDFSATEAKKHPTGLPRSAGAPDQNAVQRICDGFREVTGQSVAAQQNFFDAGATSLNLVQLHIQLQRHAFPTLTLLDLFTHPSPVALADCLPGSILPEKTEAGRPIRRRQRRMLRGQNVL